MLKLFFIGLISSTIIVGCGTAKETQQTPDTGPTTPDDNTTVEDNRVDDQFLAVMNDNRSALSDVYYGIEKNIPSVFRQQSTARDIGDPEQGYRIQILSTRNVQEADEMASDFRNWVRMEFSEYIPKAYVIFQQPYYKVHVGNFQFHDHAMKLNKKLKSRFPDAWVVHDEVEPELVPSESVSFE